MVQEANMKRAHVEKALAESEMKVKVHFLLTVALVTVG